jgi:hypothetical protein
MTKHRRRSSGTSRTAVPVLLAALIAGPLFLDVAVMHAQAPAPAARPGEVESDPIRCWWKTDTTAVRVGERFTLMLTCGVIETGPVTIVPAVNQLEPGALSITPFEVVSGQRRDDVVVPPWRYVQFDYSVRLLSDGFFGQDVNVPALTVTYNVKAPDGNTGRDQTYVLPPLPVRILSLVPRGAGDIRDASAETFAAIESRRFRSTAALIAALVCFAFAGVLAVLALLRATGRLRRREGAVARPVSSPAMLRGALRALADVQAEARGGWTPDLARRALAALRVAAAVALGRRVSQDFVNGDTTERDGQLMIRAGLLRRRRAAISAATTAHAIADQLDNGHRPGPRTRAALQQLSESLRVFSAASYGRSGIDGDALDAALAESTRAVRRLKVLTLWPARKAPARLQLRDQRSATT